MAAKRFNLNNAIVILLYVAIAVTVVLFRPAISQATGLSPGVILGIAAVLFLAITLGSVLMRRKKS